MIEEISVIAMPLPGSIRAFVVKKGDYYTICVREDMTRAERLEAYQHEIDHIRRGDYDSCLDADMIEVNAHRM